MKKLLFLLMSLLPMLASARPVDINGLWYNLNNENKTAVVVASEDQPYTGALEIPPLSPTATPLTLWSLSAKVLSRNATGLQASAFLPTSKLSSEELSTVAAGFRWFRFQMVSSL